MLWLGGHLKPLSVVGDCLGASGCLQSSTHYNREDAPLLQRFWLSLCQGYTTSKWNKQARRDNKLNNAGRELNSGLCLALPMRGSGVLKALKQKVDFNSGSFHTQTLCWDEGGILIPWEQIYQIGWMAPSVTNSIFYAMYPHYAQLW